MRMVEMPCVEVTRISALLNFSCESHLRCGKAAPESVGIRLMQPMMRARLWVVPGVLPASPHGLRRYAHSCFFISLHSSRSYGCVSDTSLAFSARIFAQWRSRRAKAFFYAVFLAPRLSTRSSKEDVTYVSGIGFCHRVRFDQIGRAHV